MRVNQYWHKVNVTFSEHLTSDDNKWRWGQTCFNVLYEVRPDLANQIAGTKYDPFHADAMDKQFGRFANWLHAHWDDEKPGVNGG